MKVSKIFLTSVSHSGKMIAVLFLAGFVLFSCRKAPVSSPLSLKRDALNLAFIYNPAESPIHPEAGILHLNDSISHLYISIPQSELLFNQANPEGRFLTSLRFHYEIYELYEKENSRKLVDSGSYKTELEKNKLHGLYYTVFPVRCRYGRQYTLRLFTYDNMRNKSMQTFLRIDKTDRNGRQYFMAFTPTSRYPVLKAYVTAGRSIVLRYGPGGIDSVYVQWYKKSQPLPLPVFSSETPKNLLIRADSTWRIALSDTLVFDTSRTGLFHFRTDTLSFDGFTLLCPGEHYPEIKTPAQMIPPLTYLTSGPEQKAIEQNPNPKAAVDNFWLTCGENVQTARDLIRAYYNRVFFANYYFTADREGWKTDRGMIYVVYGPPRTMLKTDNQEEWTYFTEAGKKVVFTFRYKPSPLTENLFVLIRNLEPSPHWRQAVDSWRSGKVFTTQ